MISRAASAWCVGGVRMDLVTFSVIALVVVTMGSIFFLLLMNGVTVVLDAITMGLETIYLFVHRKDCPAPSAPQQKRIRYLP